MKKFLLALLVFCAVTMNAQIMEVSGNQSGTWSGEVHIVGDVTVQSNKYLVIEPGTTVISDEYYGITVLGDLLAEGEKNSRITFTVADTTGYSDYENCKKGAWKGIEFIKPGAVNLKYCDFSYGKTDIDGDGGVIRIYLGKSFEISECTFHHNTARRKGGAVYAEDAELYIHDCEVYDNFAIGEIGSYCWGVGFQFLRCNIRMNDMVFHDNYSEVAYGGGMNIDSCNMDLSNAVFYNNIAVNAGGLGIQRCKDYRVRVSNMLAYNNAVLHYGGGLAIATSDPELNNLTVVNNYCGGGGGAGMQNAFDAAPTLNSCIFWGNHAIYSLNDKDTLEYYMGSQIWLWGSDCRPVFNNGIVQYGIDSIVGHEYMTHDEYNNMKDINPLFVNEKEHDYQLATGSPCIDSGLDDITGLFIPGTDLAGGPRVFNDKIDIGCYEWNNIGVNENFAEENTLSVYPNPLNDNAFCVVNLNKKSDVVLHLVSLDGREIYRENVGTFEAGEHQISLGRMVNNLKKENKLYLLRIDNQCVKIVY